MSRNLITGIFRDNRVPSPDTDNALFNRFAYKFNKSDGNSRSAFGEMGGATTELECPETGKTMNITMMANGVVEVHGDVGKYHVSGEQTITLTDTTYRIKNNVWFKVAVLFELFTEDS